MRALCAIQHSSPDRFLDTLDALYHRYWVERVPVHQPDILKQVLVDVLGSQEDAEQGALNARSFVKLTNGFQDECRR